MLLFHLSSHLSFLEWNLINRLESNQSEYAFKIVFFISSKIVLVFSCSITITVHASETFSCSLDVVVLISVFETVVGVANWKCCFENDKCACPCCSCIGKTALGVSFLYDEAPVWLMVFSQILSCEKHTVKLQPWMWQIVHSSQKLLKFSCSSMSSFSYKATRCQYNLPKPSWKGWWWGLKVGDVLHVRNSVLSLPCPLPPSLYTPLIIEKISCYLFVPF